jgi:uncharacterized membrane protein
MSSQSFSRADLMALAVKEKIEATKRITDIIHNSVIAAATANKTVFFYESPSVVSPHRFMPTISNLSNDDLLAALKEKYHDSKVTYETAYSVTLPNNTVQTKTGFLIDWS